MPDLAAVTWGPGDPAPHEHTVYLAEGWRWGSPGSGVPVRSGRGPHADCLKDIDMLHDVAAAPIGALVMSPLTFAVLDDRAREALRQDGERVFITLPDRPEVEILTKRMDVAVVSARGAGELANVEVARLRGVVQ